jgi:inhibitor of cysteine peptidase
VYVDSIELLTLESFPVQMRAIVKGNLPDTCTTITSASSERDGTAFRINFVTSRPADAVCAQMLVPFEQNVALDVAGLELGAYTVTAGEVTETFHLAVDNVLP